MGVTTESHEIVKRRRIYVTGHRNPDLDSIASAIGYAELKARLDPDNEYVAVRLGEVNAQTAWALERSNAEQPELMNHVFLRVRDVMSESFPVARHDEPVRSVGLTMAREDLDIVPIVDAEGRLIGVMTERALAHRYIRESRKTSTLVDAPTTVAKIVEVLDGELVAGEDKMIEGRVWVHSIDAQRSQSSISAGDVVVVGNRDDAQRQALELGAALLVASNGMRPEAEILELAAKQGASVVVSPLDSYVSSRMITLAAPCRALADTEPLTVDRDDLVSEISDDIKDVHYRAAVAVDRAGKPVGLVTRSDLVSPRPASRAAGGPRRGGAERSRRRGGRDRRDPRPPPHRLDRDARSRQGHVRPDRLDGRARGRALSPERDGAKPDGRVDAVVSGPLGHGPPQLPDRDRP